MALDHGGDPGDVGIVNEYDSDTHSWVWLSKSASLNEPIRVVRYWQFILEPASSTRVLQLMMLRLLDELKRLLLWPLGDHIAVHCELLLPLHVVGLWGHILLLASHLIGTVLLVTTSYLLSGANQLVEALAHCLW